MSLAMNPRQSWTNQPFSPDKLRKPGFFFLPWTKTTCRTRRFRTIKCLLLTCLYNAWMVKDAGWNSVVRARVWTCTGWFQHNFLQRKVENSPCTLTHCSCTKHWRSKALWARLQHSLARMFQQISMLHGVQSTNGPSPRSRDSLHWREWPR